MVRMTDIQAASDQIVREFQPEQIVLFGSYATGRASADSDVDLLVVMPFRGHGARQAVEIINRIQPEIPIELVVRTPQQMHERLAQHDYFLKDIVDQGKVLYAAAHR